MHETLKSLPSLNDTESCKKMFKKLIVMTPLGHKLKTMAETNSVPKGLKDQEVERGSMKMHPPIPYVHVVDEVQEALNKSKGKDGTYTIKLPDKTEFTVSVWDASTPKAFLVHVQVTINACKRKGLFSNYKAVTEDAFKASNKIATYKAVIAKEKEQAGKVKKVTEFDPPADAKESLEGAQATLAIAGKEQKAPAEGFFSQYGELLSASARYHWDKIVAAQCDIAPRMDLQGKEHERARTKSLAAFEDFVTFHLLNVFHYDAAERQCFYKQCA